MALAPAAIPFGVATPWLTCKSRSRRLSVLDLWGKVFEHLEEMLEDEYCPGSSQAPIHRLNLVCKQFRQALSCHSELVPRIFLLRSFSDRQLPSLLAWMRKHRGSFQTLVARCKSPLTQSVLAQLTELQSIQPTLKLIDAHEVSPSLLTSFKSLERPDKVGMCI